MITKFFTDKDYYKHAAFKKMREFRKNDSACLELKGRLMSSKTKAKLLNNIAFLRKRATGQESLPTIIYSEV